MGVTVATTRAAANTSTGNQTISTTDLGGLTPKAVLLIATRAVTDGTAADGAGLYVGASDGTNHWTQSYEDEHASASVDKSFIDGTNILSIYDGTADDVLEASAAFVSFQADGVTINWTDAPASAFLITATFFAGSDLTAHVGSVALGSTIDALIAVTSVGFEADNLLTFLLQGTSGAEGAVSMGFVHNDRAGTVAQRCIAYMSRQSFGTSWQNHQMRDSDCVARVISNSANLDWNGVAQSFDSSGFDVQLGGGRSPTNHALGWIALRYGSSPVVGSKVYTYSTPTATGSHTDSNPGFTPQAVFYLANRAAVADTAYLDANAGPAGFLVVDADDVYTQSIASEDNAADTNTQSLSDDALNLPTHTGASGHIASFTSFGATGVTWNYSSTDGTARLWPALAIEAAGGAAYTLTAAQGSFALAGQTAALKAGRKIAAALGTFSLTGQAAALKAGRKLTAASGTFALTGQAATLMAGRQLAAGQGSFTLTGQAASLIHGYILAANGGTFALSGQAVTLALMRRLAAGQGSFVLSGQAVMLKASRQLLADQGAFVLSGQDVTLRAARALAASQGTFTLSGQAVNLQAARKLTAGIGTFTLTGIDVVLTGPSGAFTLTAGLGGFVLSGQAAAFRHAAKLAAGQGSFTLSGQAVGLAAGRRLAAGLGSFVLTGIDATLTGPEAAFTLTAETGTFALTGQTAGLIHAARLTAGAGSFTLAGQAAGLLVGRRLGAGQGSFVLTGQDILFLAAHVLIADRGTFTLTGRPVLFVYSAAETPDERVYIVPKQARIYTITAESRIFSITAESRIFTV